ncbi:sensor histidine kinase [Pseudomonas sp. Marseille-QA0892]
MSRADDSHTPLAERLYRIDAKPSTPVRDYAEAVLAAAVASLVALAVSRLMDLPNISLVFLVAVLVVAIRSSKGPALTCAALSFIAYGYAFLPPNWSVIIHREQDLLTLFFFLVVAVATGDLAARYKRQFRALQASQRDTRALLAFAERLTQAPDAEGLLTALRQHLQDKDLELSLVTVEGEQVHRLAGGTLGLSELERITACWSWEHGATGGYDSHNLERPHWWWWPLSSSPGVERSSPIALLGARAVAPAVLDEPRRTAIEALLDTFSLAMARTHLSEALATARVKSEAEQLRSALLASVSHDLRTPLTVMRGSVETLAMLDDALAPAQRRELLSDTRSEMERLDRYIQNLLDMTRLGHGQLALDRDWVTPSDLVASALQRLQPLLEKLVVRREIAPDLPLVHVQAALIEQALVNVLENAIRFSPEGGRLTVRVQAADMLALSVIDEGPGVPAADQERIFDMFYTAARGDRGGQGTGLGLAICKGMVVAHGGHVSVSSGAEGGTCITLHLPIEEQPSSDVDDYDGESNTP